MSTLSDQATCPTCQAPVTLEITQHRQFTIVGIEEWPEHRYTFDPSRYIDLDDPATVERLAKALVVSHGIPSDFDWHPTDLISALREGAGHD